MATPAREEAIETTRMSLAEHLVELRKRLFRGVLAVVIAFLVGWAYYQPLSEFVLMPLNRVTAMVNDGQVAKYEKILAENPELERTEFFRSEDPADKHLWPNLTIEQRPVVTGIGEGFFFSMRVAMAFALAVGGPVLLYQMWKFIAAGLYAKERRMVMAYFPVSVLLFVGGVVFGAWILLPFCMEQLATAFPAELIGAQYKLEDYWTFYVTLSLALGGIFQLPIVMFALVHVDLVQRKSFARYRGHFVLFAFVFGGIITPPDPYSQFMVALPMVVLYEVGLLATWPMARRREREQKKRDESGGP